MMTHEDALKLIEAVRWLGAQIGRLGLILAVILFAINLAILLHR
jgi:hypothetical protein